MLKPLTQIREATVRLAANDLTFDIKPTRGKHEVAILSTSFVQMKDNLKHAISEISDVANTVNHTTQEMSKVADETHQGVSSQNQQIEQIATAAEEQGATANEINRNIEGIRQISEQTASAAQKTNHASESLNSQAVTLHQFVARFEV